MGKDGLILTALSLFVAILTLLMETAWRRGWMPQWLARKMLHLGAVGACALAPALLHELVLLTSLVSAAEIFLLFAVASGRLFMDQEGGKSWGIALFPLAYLVLLMAFPDRRWLVVTPMAILAVSDAAAAVAGHLLARRYFQLTGDRKSVVGSCAFFLFTLALLVLVALITPTWAPFLVRSTPIWASFIFIALILTALEALGSTGWDNVLIPLGSALLLGGLPGRQVDPDLSLMLWAGVGLAAVFIPMAVKKKWLDPGGAVTAAVVGLWVLFFSGWMWLLPLLLFFGTSVALGKLSGANYPTSDVKKGRPRDFMQVVCNGGIYAVLSPFSLHQDATATYFTAMAISISVSTADTWSSEIGMYFKRIPVDILRFTFIPVGVSGGITLPGTAGGLLGACGMAWFCNLLIHGQFIGDFFFAVAFSGFGGMLLDSVLGSAFQARFRNPHTGLLSDKQVPGAWLVSGQSWMTNDLINLISNAFITGVALTLGWW